jgi:hypothetical protein
VVENKSIFQLKSEMHGINTRQNSNLYQPQANLTLYQKGVYYSGVKIFNNLPPNIRNLFSDIKRFKLELVKYLHLKSIYTLEEYYNSCGSQVYGKNNLKSVPYFHYLYCKCLIKCIV